MSAKINDGMTRSQRYYHRHKEQRAAYSKQYNKKKSLERERERADSTEGIAVYEKTLPKTPKSFAPHSPRYRIKKLSRLGFSNSEICQLFNGDPSKFTTQQQIIDQLKKIFVTIKT